MASFDSLLQHSVMAARKDITVIDRISITVIFNLMMLGMLKMNSMTLKGWETSNMAGLRPMLIWAFNGVVSPD